MSKKILAVDDEAEILMMLEERLKMHGFEVIKAASGKEAVAKIRETAPSLVLLDIDMPFMNGFQVLEAFKKNPETASIPVIMLTAKGESKNIFKAEEMKASDYLIKPFQADELLEMIKRHL